jgi:hypothetical protein
MTRAAALLIVLSACGSVAKPVSLGSGTYLITGTGAWSWTSGATVQAELYKEANAFCAKQGKELMPTGGSQRDGGFAQFGLADLQFRCLAHSDPELNRPVEQRAPDAGGVNP